jgi:hypothetical protein
MLGRCILDDYMDSTIALPIQYHIN